MVRGGGGFEAGGLIGGDRVCASSCPTRAGSWPWLSPASPQVVRRAWAGRLFDASGRGKSADSFGDHGAGTAGRHAGLGSLRTRFENASRRVLRLRQKVVVPTLPTAAPRWVVDPDFNLDFHVRRVRVSGPATLREVLDLAEVILQSPLDISRPLWTATLVEVWLTAERRCCCTSAMRSPTVSAAWRCSRRSMTSSAIHHLGRRRRNPFRRICPQ